MSVDPNVYALSIQLQLDSTEAFKTLDTFGDSIGKIEQQVTDAVSKSLQNINDTTQQVQSSLGVIADLSSNINSSMRNISITTATDTAENTTANAAKELNNLIEKKEILEENLNILNESHDITTRELRGLEDNLKQIDDITKAISKKNVGHSEENDYIEKDNKLLGESHKSIISVSKAVNSLSGLWSKFSGKVGGLITSLAKIDAGTEAFVQTNYRAYGSQQLLLQSTRQLSSEIGVSSEVAVATYKALADVRTPREEIDKYAKVVAMANRTTGVAVQTLAIYTARLRFLGVSSDQLESNVRNLTERMRKFGLTTEEISRTIAGISDKASELKILFGGNTSELTKFADAFSTLKGVAKEAGIDAASALDEFTAKATDPVNWRVLQQITDTQIDNVDDYKVALLKLGQEISALQKEAASSSADSIEKARISGIILGKLEAIGGNARTADALAAMYNRATKEAGGAVKSVEQFDKVMEIMANNVDKQYSESIATLYAQLRIFKESISPAFTSVLQFVADGLMYLVRGINAVIVPISSIITYIMKTVYEWEKSYPVFGAIVKIFKFLAASLVAIGIVLVVAATALASFVGIVVNAIISLFIFGTTTTLITRNIQAITKTLSRSITQIMQAIGQGLNSLASAVSSSVLPLIGLSFALLLVAASAMGFAYAVKILADTGQNGAIALVGLTVALSAFLIILLTLGAPAAPVALAIGVAMLAMGAAALLMGLGVMAAAAGFKELVKVINLDVIMTMSLAAISFTIASSLIYAGALIVYAAAIVLIAAGSSMIAGVMLVTVGLAMLLSMMPLVAASMVSSSIVLYFGLMSIESSISRFTKIIDDILIVSSSMMLLASSLTMLNEVSLGKLKTTMEEALGALSDIDKLATGLDSASARLLESVNKFSKPADKLSAIFERLGNAMSDFRQGLKFSDDISDLARTLDNNASLLESTAKRVDTVINNTAVPSIRSGRTGVAESVVSEPISTVKVMTVTEGGNRETDENQILAAQLAALQSLVGFVSNLNSEQGGPAEEILKLLQSYLPGVSRKETGLISGLNAWG